MFSSCLTIQDFISYGFRQISSIYIEFPACDQNSLGFWTYAKSYPNSLIYCDLKKIKSGVQGVKSAKMVSQYINITP